MSQMPQGKFLIENIPFESTSAAWLVGVVQKSILNQDGFDWTPVKIERITNRVLERQYDVKRAEVSRFSGSDLEERYGFTAELDSFRLDLILADGLQAGMVNCNALGFAEYGVYVSEHLDVALRYSTLKSHDVQNAYVVVYKYILARNTKCVPKSAVSFERIDPTIGYDSHNSIIPPKPNDPITTQFERSQIYLYELNSQDIPMPRPRHCLPIAVITYRRNTKPERETETRSQVDDRFAGNPALRAIVEKINAKTNQSVPPPSVRGQAQLQPGILPTPVYNGHSGHTGCDDRFKDNPRLKELIDRINSRTPWLSGRFGPRQETRYHMDPYYQQDAPPPGQWKPRPFPNEGGDGGSIGGPPPPAPPRYWSYSNNNHEEYDRRPAYTQSRGGGVSGGGPRGRGHYQHQPRSQGGKY